MSVDNWSARSPIHLSAYVMWRLNWIHPFFGGNGRTSRAVSYLVLLAKLGYVLPGVLSIPEQIVTNRQPYYQALDDADLRWHRKQVVDVSKMEELISQMLLIQLGGVLDAARRAGYRQVSLTVHPDNPAQHLYAQCGFRKVERRANGFHLMVAPLA